MSGASRFVRNGLRDAERRVARLTAPPDPSADRRIVELLRASIVMAVLTRVLDRLTEAARASATAATLQVVAEGWRQAAAPLRRAWLGSALLAAVFVHVSLRVWQGVDPGWMWLIVPVTTAAIGTVLVAAARNPRESSDS